MAPGADVSGIVNLAGLISCAGAAAGEGRRGRRAREVHVDGVAVVHGLCYGLCGTLAVLSAHLGAVVATGTSRAAIHRVAGCMGGNVTVGLRGLGDFGLFGLLGLGCLLVVASALDVTEDRHCG